MSFFDVEPQTLVSDALIEAANRDLEQMIQRFRPGRRGREGAGYIDGYRSCLADLGLLKMPRMREHPRAHNKIKTPLF